MKKPIIRKLRVPHPELGVTIALVALAMVAIMGMAVLSIDLVTLYLAREEAQRSADAAALAAARVLAISGITGDPDNLTTHWSAICGPNGAAKQAAAGASRRERGREPDFSHGDCYLFGWYRRNRWHRNVRLHHPHYLSLWR